MKHIELTRAESAALKGIAILFIALHNFFHWLPFAVSENEYQYNYYKTYHMYEHVKQLSPNLFIDFFSYFGHYGVPVFVFLSGYGMAKKYESGKPVPSFLKFTSYNFLKFWKLMFLAYVLFFVADFYYHNYSVCSRWNVIDVLCNFTYIVNLLPNPDKNVYPGPYWYFSLTLQLYFFYYLLIMRTGRRVLSVSIVTSILLQAVAMFYIDAPGQHDAIQYLRYNFVGSLLPFCMGVWMARYPIPFNRWMIIPAAGITVLCCFNALSWLAAPFFVVVMAVCFIKFVHSKGISVLAWLGALSSYVFVIHPSIRLFTIGWGKSGSPYLAALTYMGVTLVLAIGYKWLLAKVSNKK